MTGSTVVVKCGGIVAEQPGLLCRDLAERYRAGDRLLLVHGGSSDIDRLAGQLGVPQRRLVGPGGVSGRYTDPATLELVTMSLAGVAKPRLVAALVSRDVRALGLTGLDAATVRAEAKKPFRAAVDGRSAIIRDDRSGRISAVDVSLLETLLDAGVLPVLSPPAFSPDGPLNVDADRMAAAVAAAIGARELVLLSDVPGVLRDRADPTSLIEKLPIPMDGPPSATGGGMGAKLTAARTALLAGVRVRIASGLEPAPLSRALAGAGTEVLLEPMPG